MADIAQRLGISTVSVSKGLAGKEGVSAEMRAKILATAEEMGYQPPARTNAHPGGESIGILVADRFFNENAFYSNLYRSVLRCAAEQDISVLMEIVLPQAEKSCNMPTFLVNRKVDGLIFMGEISRRYLATAVQTGVPFMLLDFYDDAIAADCVLSDNTSGSYTIWATSRRCSVPVCPSGTTGGWRTGTIRVSSCRSLCLMKCRTPLSATAMRWPIIWWRSSSATATGCRRMWQ